MIQNRNALSYISSASLGVSNHVRSSKSKGFAPKKGKPQPRRGRVCPSCGLERSVTGVCDCNAV